MLSTSLTIDEDSRNKYRPPSIVMQTAVTPLNADEPWEFSWEFSDPTTQVLMYLHFAEVEELKVNQSREFNIFLNGEYWHGPLTPEYLATTTIYSSAPESAGKFRLSISKTSNSTHPPIINALQVYGIKRLLKPQTDQKDGKSSKIYNHRFFSISCAQYMCINTSMCASITLEITVDAIMSIKSMYEVKKNWQGDPCAPKTYIWDGLNCSYDGHEPPRIISL